MSGSPGYQPHPAITRLRPIVDGLAHALGNQCEIVLHDLAHPSKSLVHVAGNLTGRRPGAPVTNLVLEALHEHGDDAPDLFNYRTAAPDGRPLRSSTIFLREKDHIVGALCVNIDVGALEDLRDLIDDALAVEDPDPQQPERFGNTVGEVLGDLISSVLDGRGGRRRPMTTEERTRIVAELERRGAFMVRGAVEIVAQRLDVSRFTIYGYLKQIRTAAEDADPSATFEGTSL